MATPRSGQTLAGNTVVIAIKPVRVARRAAGREEESLRLGN
jgi:hypothetical protein